jgi:hypothetical protein
VRRGIGALGAPAASGRKHKFAPKALRRRYVDGRVSVKFAALAFVLRPDNRRTVGE